MPAKTTYAYMQRPDMPEDLPSVSLIIPFEPKMNNKTELNDRLKTAADKIEKELVQSYSEEKARPVIKKLRRLTQDFNYNGHNKNIAIFVSPLIEKVYYFTFY